MTAPRRSRGGRLLNALGVAALIAASLALAIGRPVSTAASPRPAIEPPDSARPEIITYATGYGLALAMTIAAFALVHWRWATQLWTLAIVFGLGLVQIVVHFRCFLHVSLRERSRESLALILFSTVIILLMVGGTLVILFNLRMRMM